jgi:hypothetical protein
MRARERWLLVALVCSACASSNTPVTGTPDGAAPGADGPSPDVAGATCALDRPYGFYRDGGLRVFQDISKLTPPRQHTLTRDHRAGTLQTCTRIFPCETADALARAIAHPDVAEAMKLAMRPHYGSDPRPVDGTIFLFVRDDGRGFSLGPGDVPAGVRALETLLTKVEEESLASPECAALR